MSDLNHQYDSPIELNNKIAEIERIYNQYSDVKVFVKKFRAMVNAIDIKKKYVLQFQDDNNSIWCIGRIACVCCESIL